MSKARTLAAPIAICGLFLVSGIAPAQADERGEMDKDMGLFEITGGYGFQIGNTEYIPDGSLTDRKYPLVHGFTAGSTVGGFVLPNLALIINYEYSNHRSIKGDVDGAVDEIQGEIDYHTLDVGGRVYVPAGPGHVTAELAVGVVFPYETELELDYGPALAQVGITGKGRRIEEYGVGLGGHATIGYQLMLGEGPAYLGLNFRLETYQSENKGDKTKLRNFVADFEQTPPEATTTDIRHGDGSDKASPSTHAVQEATVQLSLGTRF